MLFEAPTTDAVLQTCVSPSGRYVVVLVAPDAVSNPYDTYQLPLPERLETQVIELDDGSEVVVARRIVDLVVPGAARDDRHRRRRCARRPGPISRVCRSMSPRGCSART